ncbi:hypothetical protein D3C81_2209800 [compost metagenome]
MRLKQLSVLQIVGILHISGRMVLRDIGGFKIIKFRLYFQPIFYDKSHGLKNVFYLFLNNRYWVKGSMSKQ